MIRISIHENLQSRTARPRVLALSSPLLLLLLCTCVDALACFTSARRDGVVKSPLLSSPDRQADVWHEIASSPEPRYDLGKLVIRDRANKREETLFQARATPHGKIILADSQETSDTFHVYCYIDWSPDSRFLLIREILGTADGDSWSDGYWTFDRRTWKQQKLDTQPLHRSVEGLLKKKRLPDNADYDVIALGWDEKTQRVLFQAYPFHTPQDFFIGIWSVAMSGSDPRLITDKKNNIRVKQFGSVSRKVP